MIRLSSGFPTVFMLERRPEKCVDRFGAVSFRRGWVFRITLCNTPFHCHYRALKPSANSLPLVDGHLTLAGVSLRWLRYC